MNKCPDTSEKAGRGCVGGFPRLFAAPAARPAGALSVISNVEKNGKGTG